MISPLSLIRSVTKTEHSTVRQSDIYQLWSTTFLFHHVTMETQYNVTQSDI